MNKPLKSQLKERQKNKPINKAKKDLSDRELHELMGIHRPTYARKKGGAFIQK